MVQIAVADIFGEASMAVFGRRIRFVTRVANRCIANRGGTVLADFPGPVLLALAVSDCDLSWNPAQRTPFAPALVEGFVADAPANAGLQ